MIELVYMWDQWGVNNQFQMAIDTSRDLGFLVGQNNPFVEILNLIIMTFVTKFNYTQGKYPWFDAVVPGEWGIAVDSSRGLLYVGVDCDIPTPGIIWQWNVTSLNSTTFVNNTVWGSDPCFWIRRGRRRPGLVL